ncbi:Cytochrome c peroxidase, mitochondrial [Hondaea fermentalgiana]|uniref:Cytochrome c peroxidase, mitochondrial n=1 Tax=Hondaea fermentalgiana TaxID=2315210 RepID=A0A2R5GLG3_9STRA|nr:Cytochrome c peroxidase, mitochondrial [Hondaea fermentalgiana]|eukprot:GBG31717.1 Cytochrome c peroxidase, mitochondrial [Hondaea fermentalgiana]
MDLREVRRAIARLMYAPGHDDGSYAPLFIRFAWHCSGTYCKESGNGGSWGSTFRFENEAADPENAGLSKAKELLESVKARFPAISYADLYILAGAVAIESTGGPHIPVKTGRPDFDDAEATAIFGEGKCPFGFGTVNPNTSRLPAADLGPDPDAPPDAPAHIREAPTINAVRATFQRLGLTDKETVCLILLGHQFGRCHPENSGYEHAWYAFDPTEWNAYETGLGYISLYEQGIRNYREVHKASGKRQYEMFFAGRRWMLLIADMVLYWDQDYYRHVVYYNRNRRIFRQDAALAWTKLTELGCKNLTPELTAHS